MSYLASIVSGLALGAGAVLAYKGMRGPDVQAEGLGLAVMALAAIAWAIIGLKG